MWSRACSQTRDGQNVFTENENRCKIDFTFLIYLSNSDVNLISTDNLEAIVMVVLYGRVSVKSYL